MRVWSLIKLPRKNLKRSWNRSSHYQKRHSNKILLWRIRWLDLTVKFLGVFQIIVKCAWLVNSKSVNIKRIVIGWGLRYRIKSTQELHAIAYLWPPRSCRLGSKSHAEGISQCSMCMDLPVHYRHADQSKATVGGMYHPWALFHRWWQCSS